MSNGLSSLDPVFWLHHCNIDRIWAEWEAARNVSSDPGNSYANHFIDENRKPVQNANSTGAIQLSNFDYTYDTLQSSVVANTAHRLRLESLVKPGESPLARLKLTEPQTLAQGAATQELKVNAVTEIAVEIPNLLTALGETRIFRATEAFGLPRNAIEPSRLVAKIEGLVPPNDPAVSVGVFVNCPYLTPDTPSYDPTCAGVITFFGVHQQAGDVTRTYYVDLSDALRTLGAEGRIASNKVSVQLLPVGLVEGAPSDISLGHPKVTILST
jgi:tyrosinase